MKINNIFAGAFALFFIYSCTAKDDKNFSEQLENYIMYKGNYCYPDFGSSFVSNLSYLTMIKNGYIVYVHNTYLINQNLESQVYLTMVSHKDSQYSRDSVPLFCQKTSVRIKGVEAIDNGKRVYFSVNTPNMVDNIIDVAEEHIAEFRLFDNQYKLKDFDGYMLSIDEINKIYNNDINVKQSNIDFSPYITDELFYLSEKCSQSVAPTTLVSVIYAQFHGDINNMKNGTSFCNQIHSIGNELTNQYIIASKIEKDPQKALRVSLNNYGNGINEVRFADAVHDYLVNKQLNIYDHSAVHDSIDNSETITNSRNYADQVIDLVTPFIAVPNNLDKNTKLIVKVELNPNLTVKNIATIKSSGNEIYDKNVRDSILKIKKFPNLPYGANFTDYKVIRLTFRPLMYQTL